MAEKLVSKFWRDTTFLLIRVPSIIVAPSPEKPLHHDNLVIVRTIFEEFDEYFF